MSVNFYERQTANKINSVLLAGFCAGLLILVVYFIGIAWLGSPLAGLILGGAVAVFLTIISYFAGGSIIMAVSGAKEITHMENPRLFNVVEEMSIAGGVPMPRVFIINDSAPNAFATGRNPKKSAVAITTGLLDKLNRDELQGVMAHEVSHIKNYDILFAMLMGIMVGVIAMLCDFFRRSAFSFRGYRGRTSNRKGGGGAQALIFIIALILSIVAPIIAKLIQLAVSRQREYLADASAAEITRNPLGLASALQKISNDKEVLEVANRATQHLYIVNPIKPFEERAAFLFSTHPPIQERVKRLKEMAGQHE